MNEKTTAVCLQKIVFEWFKKSTEMSKMYKVHVSLSDKTYMLFLLFQVNNFNWDFSNGSPYNKEKQCSLQ